MGKYDVYIDCDYVIGHLRYGHLEGVVSANSVEEAEKIAMENIDLLDLVIDDYDVDGYEADEGSIVVTEVE